MGCDGGDVESEPFGLVVEVPGGGSGRQRAAEIPCVGGRCRNALTGVTLALKSDLDETILGTHEEWTAVA